MKLIRARDYKDMSRKAANIISAQVIMQPGCTLGLATGSTPLGTYRQLIEWYKKGDLDFGETSTVNLDEYCDLPKENPQSYWHFMHENFFDHINLRPERIHLPNGLARDSEAECGRYDAIIRQTGGIDLQLLGIGRNGHIGFNEPDEHFSKGTHQVTLTESTLAANRRFFEREEDVPRRAYSLGMQAILQAKKILLLACGEEKADALCASLYGPVSARLPASILQLHSDVVVIADEAALCKCPARSLGD